jgi:hypothetical protein
MNTVNHPSEVLAITDADRCAAGGFINAGRIVRLADERGGEADAWVAILARVRKSPWPPTAGARRAGVVAPCVGVGIGVDHSPTALPTPAAAKTQ